MTKPAENHTGLSPAAWRKLLAGIASLVAGTSAVSSTGATIDDLQPLLDKGGLIAALFLFAYLAWTQILAMVKEAISALWSIRDRMSEMVTKHAEITAKQELHDARLDSVDGHLASIDRRLDDLQASTTDNHKAQR